MNFILRGLLTLKERKGRTGILLAIMLTVCIVMISSFGIQSATDAAAILARQKLGATVSLSQDMSKMMEQQREQSSTEGVQGNKLKFERVSVPLEYASVLSEYEHVTGYFASNSLSANLDGAEAVGVEEEVTTTENTTMPNVFQNGGQQGIGGGKMDMGDVTLNGVNAFNMSTDYIDGNVSLVEGREITSSDLGTNVIMVEETFAEENELEVGSTLTIKDTSDENSIECKIVGIYKSYSEISDQGFRNTAMLPYNSIVVPYTLVDTLNGVDETTTVDSIKFYLDDPINVEGFIEFAESTEVDFDTFTLDAGNKEYESMMQPIENVASFSKTTILIVTIFGGLILALIIVLSIKDRINEIGILMSLGEKRVKIIGQFLTETIAVLVIAIGISIACGNVISNKVSDVLLAKELTVEESSTNETGMQGMGNRPTGGNRPGMEGGNQTTAEKIEDLDVSISSEDIQQMALLSLIVVTLATIIPSISIMRYNPKKILSTHS